MRITHLPTGIVVQCQNDRSQHKNRAQAWDMLRSRLYEAEMRKREEAADAENAAKSDIGWGHQIRSYVLQPYQLVKDLRTGVEFRLPQDVLDGDLDPFMAASLAQKIGGDERRSRGFGVRPQEAAASPRVTSEHARFSRRLRPASEPVQEPMERAGRDGVAGVPGRRSIAATFSGAFASGLSEWRQLPSK